MGTKAEGIFRDYLRGRGLKFTPERQVILKGYFLFIAIFDTARILKREVFFRTLLKNT
jgi:hypothetical protein